MTNRAAFVLAVLLPLAAAACGSDDLAEPTSSSSSTSSTTSTSTPDASVTPAGVDGRVDPGTEVSGDRYEGWILDPDVEGGWLYGDDASPEALTPEDVAAAEAILEDALPAARDGETNEYTREQLREVVETLGRYTRQYLGAVDADGARLVAVNALCTTDLGGEPDRLATEVAVVMDGGACFWQATVDLTHRELRDVSVNGDA